MGVTFYQKTKKIPWLVLEILQTYKFCFFTPFDYTAY